MARGNWPVVALGVRVPHELFLLLKRYQNDRRMSSINSAVIELLETHPAVARMVADLYAEASNKEVPPHDGNSALAAVLRLDLHRDEVPDPGRDNALRR